MLSADLDFERANHAIEAVDEDREGGDSIAVTAYRQSVNGDCAPQAAVHGTEAADQRTMSVVLIILSDDRAPQWENLESVSANRDALRVVRALV